MTRTSCILMQWLYNSPQADYYNNSDTISIPNQPDFALTSKYSVEAENTSSLVFCLKRSVIETMTFYTKGEHVHVCPLRRARSHFTTEAITFTISPLRRARLPFHHWGEHVYHFTTEASMSTISPLRRARLLFHHWGVFIINDTYSVGQK